MAHATTRVSTQTPADGRVLVLAATQRDASLTQTLLEDAGVGVEICASFEALVQELNDGAGAVLVAEEVMSSRHNAALGRLLAAQPPWSDLPVLVLARPGADSAELGDAVRSLGNVTLLERPVRVAALLSAVRTALRARERQYQIREHLADRARAEESLRLADQRKDEFLATLGHELRNPLAPLLTGLELLKLAAQSDPTVERVSTTMERQTRHLIRLVDDLLEVSRITRGAIEVRREAVVLPSIVLAAVETSRPAIVAGDHALTLDFPPEPVTVWGDPVRLTQVFGNLLTNAAKYTPAGGHIHVTLRHERNTAQVFVRDNGIGIPPAHLTSVFDMFTQIDRSNRQTQGGLGIGLTLVQSLVTLHGGRVEARSEGSGKGSEFLVELPVLASATATVQPSGTPNHFPPRRIMVVDDNTDAGDTLGALLNALGAIVSVVRSGQAALEALDSVKPDTVLLDIGMPEMNGFELARRIRANPAHAGIMLIALTGWGQAQDLKRSQAAGIDHHLVKPLDIDRLRALLVAADDGAPAPEA
jgi:signal transduction histidine kinase/ActR/RegA family two-component response regulator